MKLLQFLPFVIIINERAEEYYFLNRASFRGLKVGPLN